MGLVEALHHHAKLRLLRRQEYECLPLRLWFAADFGVAARLCSYRFFDRHRRRRFGGDRATIP